MDYNYYNMLYRISRGSLEDLQYSNSELERESWLIAVDEVQLNQTIAITCKPVHVPLNSATSSISDLQLRTTEEYCEN